MPNWAFGSMMLRGSEENILRFFKESFDGVVIRENEEDTRHIVRLGGEDNDRHICGTDRCFVREAEIEVELLENCVSWGTEIEIECAWDLDEDGFREISKKYNLNAAVYVDETGCAFSHYFECESGEILRNEVTDYIEEEE